MLSKYQKEAFKELECLVQHKDAGRVFDDLVTIILCCLTLQQMEDVYLEIIKRYDKDDVDRFAKIMGLLIHDDETVDKFGDFYMEIVGRWKASGMGQFFTPWEVSVMMAKMTVPEKPVGKSICDPASGSGRTLLAVGYDNPDYVKVTNRYYAMDLDQICVKMCAVNMCLWGLLGYSVWMDSLSLKVYGGYRIHLHPEHHMPMITPMTEDEQSLFAANELKQYHEKLKEKEAVSAVHEETESLNQASQLTLF